jgi:YD repeat-containing protein
MFSASHTRRSSFAIPALVLTLLLVAFSLVLADVTYQYDPDGRLTCVSTSSGVVKYSYDPDGNITSVIRSNTSCPTPTATSTP